MMQLAIPEPPGEVLRELAIPGLPYSAAGPHADSPDWLAGVEADVRRLLAAGDYGALREQATRVALGGPSAHQLDRLDPDTARQYNYLRELCCVLAAPLHVLELHVENRDSGEVAVGGTILAEISKVRLDLLTGYFPELCRLNQCSLRISSHDGQIVRDFEADIFARIEISAQMFPSDTAWVNFHFHVSGGSTMAWGLVRKDAAQWELRGDAFIPELARRVAKTRS